MPLTSKFRVTGVLTIALLLTGVETGRAQSCSFSISDMSFGFVDTLSGSAADSTATVTATCSGLALQRVLICPSIGAGSGGANASARQVASGPDTLDYQLYSDAARTQIWGSYLWAFSARPPALALTLGLLGGGSESYTVYGRLPAGQATSPAGSYLSAFSGADTAFYYRYSLGNDCSSLTGSLANPTFSVTASVADNCLIATADVDFGSQGVLSANIDTTGTVSVTCTPGSAYSVGLDNGAAGTGPTARRMSRGGETVTYGLYQDAARSLPWGDDAVPGTSVSGTGSGLAQPYTVFGRVPQQVTPSPGSYADTVVVTVSY